MVKLEIQSHAQAFSTYSDKKIQDWRTSKAKTQALPKVRFLFTKNSLLEKFILNNKPLICTRL